MLFVLMYYLLCIVNSDQIILIIVLAAGEARRPDVPDGPCGMDSNGIIIILLTIIYQLLYQQLAKPVSRMGRMCPAVWIRAECRLRAEKSGSGCVTGWWEDPGGVEGRTVERRRRVSGGEGKRGGVGRRDRGKDG